MRMSTPQIVITSLLGILLLLFFLAGGIPSSWLASPTPPTSTSSIHSSSSSSSIETSSSSPSSTNSNDDDTSDSITKAPTRIPVASKRARQEEKEEDMKSGEEQQQEVTTWQDKRDQLDALLSNSSVTDSEILTFINPDRGKGNELIPSDSECPAYRPRFGKDADSKTNARVVDKYAGYVSKYCSTSGMLQMHFSLRQFLGIADIVAAVVHLKPGMRILSLGMGCGTELNLFHIRYGVSSALGFDITPNAVNHARAHAQSSANLTLCHYDAALLKAGTKHFPKNSFSAIIAFAVLYHVRRQLVQCSIVMEVCKMLKPGAVALFGNLRTSKTQNFWRNKGKSKCYVKECSVRRVDDSSLYKQKSFKRNGFFSLVVTRLTDDVVRGKEEQQEAQRAEKAQKQSEHRDEEEKADKEKENEKEKDQTD